MRSCSWSHFLACYLKAESAAFKAVPRWQPYRDFWRCLYCFGDKKGSAFSSPEAYSKSAFKSLIPFHMKKIAKDLSCFQIYYSKLDLAPFGDGLQPRQRASLQGVTNPTMLPSDVANLGMTRFAPDPFWKLGLCNPCFTCVHTLNYRAMIKCSEMKIHLRKFCYIC